ncbi:MAG: hypothetical protein IPL65_14560 [Lewinellaceae bacterium]|nr:hypothetical protein [Lewinellaceae bacterium]
MLLLAALIFSGCPVSTDYPLGENGTEKIDKNLFGTWTTDNADSEVKKVTINSADNLTYNVSVQEKGEMYAAEEDQFKAWLTRLDKRTFLVLQELSEGTDTGNYFLYHLRISKKELVTHDVSLLKEGIDAVVSTEAFRKEVSASLKDAKCLTSEIVWLKEK